MAVNQEDSPSQVLATPPILATPPVLTTPPSVLNLNLIPQAVWENFLCTNCGESAHAKSWQKGRVSFGLQPRLKWTCDYCVWEEEARRIYKACSCCGELTNEKRTYPENLSNPKQSQTKCEQCLSEEDDARYIQCSWCGVGCALRVNYPPGTSGVYCGRCQSD
jgi:hypothetical protein